MAEEHKGNYAGKHSPDRKADPGIVEAVKKGAANMVLTCTTAFRIADEKKVTPEEVGFTTDTLEIQLGGCQLGLFGYGSQRSIVRAVDSVSTEVEAAIKNALVEDRLSCAAAWKIAEENGIAKLDVANACETLGVKLAGCQLGAF